MVFISKRQKELNESLGSYLSKRKSEGHNFSFFKKVDSIIPSSSQSVPKVDESQATVYDNTSRKKRFSLFSLFSRGSKNPTEYESADELDEDVSEEIDEVEEEISEVDDQAESIETKRTSLFSRLFSFLSGRSKEDIPEEEIAEEVETESDELYTETRDALKIIHKWINRLSPQQIESFKRSPDFDKYKDILDKYNLIK
ncbi:MAG: hypothetical protein ACQESC_00100 [Nanobdellota archaeon]